MSILVRCDCNTDYKRTVKKCPSCGKAATGGPRKYRVRLMHAGKRVSRMFDSYELAEKWERQTKLELEEQRYIDRRRQNFPTVAECWDLFVRADGPNLKGTQGQCYKFDKHIRPRFGDVKINELRPASIEKFKADLHVTSSRYGRPLGAASIRSALSLLRRAVLYGIKTLGHKMENPFSGIRIPNSRPGKARALGVGSFRDLYKAAGEFDHDMTFGALVRLLCLTGCRRSELLTLEWQNVNFAAPSIRLDDTKNGTSAEIPLNAGAVSVLKEQALRTGRRSGLVFPAKHGGPRTSTHYCWSLLCAAAGLPKDTRMHDTRHSVATHAAASGLASISDIRELLRHSSNKQTEHYARALPEQARRVVDIVDRIARGEGADLTPRRRGRA
jgi:integrase